MQHPSFETLVAYTERQLSTADRIVVAEHLAAPCESCRTRLGRLEVALQAAAGDRTAAPPAAILRRALAVFKKPPKPRMEIKQPQRAGLVFDSWLQPSMSGVRGPLEARQLLFRVGKIDIDLQIAPERDQRRLLGQILGSEEANDGPSAFISLTGKDGAVVQGAEADRLGQFAFRRIPLGTYDLVFDIQGQEIAITDLNLGNDE